MAIRWGRGDADADGFHAEEPGRARGPIGGVGFFGDAKEAWQKRTEEGGGRDARRMRGGSRVEGGRVEVDARPE